MRGVASLCLEAAPELTQEKTAHLSNARIRNWS
jgi:hypothetical protein